MFYNQISFEQSNLLPLSLTEDTKVDISVTGEVNPAFDFVKKGKLGELQNFLSSQSVDWVEKIDGDKKTVLHWAVVFGILDLLLNTLCHCFVCLSSRLHMYLIKISY